MGTLLCNATGNLTGAATFAAAEVGALALNLVRSNTTQLSGAASVTSATFTVTAAKVIDGVLLWMNRDYLLPVTGTLKVDLQKGGVSQASVTVNKADIPLSSSAAVGLTAPVFFKFTGTATGDGGANWTIVLTGTGTGYVTYAYTNVSSTSFTRALRTTTAATPAAVDDLYVVGELTGAGTNTSRTVTMNSTAATAYGNGALNSTTVAGGGIHVSNYGTLTYGTTAATNYILRVNGDLIVYAAGTLNIGSSGAEIPRNSTAVLEFQQLSTDGDFGLRCLDYSVVNAAGLSRTSGKNVVKCKLTADVASSSLVTSQQNINSSSGISGFLEATGNSFLAAALTDSATNATHSIDFNTTGVVSNTTQTASTWLARGSGTNNRFVRVTMGNNVTQSSVTNGFYSDIDLQAGTAGTVTVIGNGTATSVSITPVGAGYLVKMTGKVSSGSASTSLLLNSCAVAGVPSYAGNSTQCFIFDHVAIVTAASISDTTFNVDTDTGWLNGDAVCVASTTRTAVDCEIYPLNANAGASSFTSALYPFGGSGGTSVVSTHHGTSPVQAEIGLITRNVKIRSTSTTLMSYMYCTALATVNVSWAEFYYLGHFGAGKRGIEVETGYITNPKSFTYCSLHDFDNYGFFIVANTPVSANVTFSNNIFWNSYAQAVVTINSAIVNGDWTFDSNLIMRPVSNGFSLTDCGGICTNNTVVGASANGFVLAGNVGEPLGLFDGNVAHSNGGIGLSLSTVNYVGTISNFTAWRNLNSGVVYNNNQTDLVFTNLTLFGNSASVNQGQFYIGYSDTVTIRGGLIAGDSSFPIAAGITSGIYSLLQLNFTNVDMSGTGSIFAPHTQYDIYGVQAVNALRGSFNNCKFGAPAVFISKNVWSKGAYLSFEKYNQTAGDHRTEMAYGLLKIDTAIYNTAAPSLRMTPSSNYKLESAPQPRGIVVPVNSGAAVTASVYVRKDATYSGNQPRVVVRANPAIGIASDTVVATDVSSPTLTNATWDPATAAIATLSGGNLVVTSGSGGGEHGVRVDPVAGSKAVSKYYFELTLTTLAGSPGSNTGVGICTTASTYTAMGSNGVTGVAMFPLSGNIFASGNSNLTLGARATGDKIGIAVDLDNRRIWFRVAPSGLWNGCGSDNPATNVGGIVIPPGAMVPVCTFNATGNVFTANFGATAFTGAVPTGFTSGWSTVANASAWNLLSGTTITATEDGAMEFVVDCDGSGYINVDDWAFAGAAPAASGMKNWYNGLPAIGGGGGGGGGSFSGGFF